MKVCAWFKRKRRLTLLCALGIVAVLTISACIKPIDVTTGDMAALARSALTGEELFSQPFPEAKNERSCATCHVPADNFTLTPAHVARLLAENPNDPLFSAIDADDPTANPLTFEHLKKGLVRVWITLPGNMDQIDDAGNVITPVDRKIFVWRGVPSIADAVMTAPYQLDGRAATLESQAQGAISSHSEGVTAPASELARIAEFERATFTADRVRDLANLLASGAAPGELPDVEGELELTPQEARGR
jgi:cytochrome c peroxidase